MPILQNAKKALRVSKRKAAVNRPVRSRLKTAVDAVKKKAKNSSLSSAFSAIDKAVKRNVIHRKKAARLKSQLAKTGVEAAPKAAPAKKTAKAKPAKAKTTAAKTKKSSK
jgi:small subunit ribosomal protein S20